MTDEITGGPHSRLVHWIAAALIVVGFGTCGAALILANIPAGVVGGVLTVAGVVMTVTTGLMQNVEEYPSHRDGS